MRRAGVMNLPSTSSPWQPLTFGGVAAFALGRTSQLCKVQLLVALGAALCLLWFFTSAWFPVLDAAIRNLPVQAEIRGGRLQWGGETPARLAGSSFLSVAVDLEARSTAASAADVKVVLGATALRLESLLGHWSVRYPKGWVFYLSRSDMGPWWEARQPFLLMGILFGSMLALLIAWWLLAVAYGFLVKGAARLLRREIRFGGCWRLGAAALLPGAAVMSIVIVFYGLHRLPLPGLLLGLVVHVVIGWVYLLGAPLWLPRRQVASAAGANPFQPDAASPAGADRARNPFHR